MKNEALFPVWVTAAQRGWKRRRRVPSNPSAAGLLPGAEPAAEINSPGSARLGARIVPSPSAEERSSLREAVPRGPPCRRRPWLRGPRLKPKPSAAAATGEAAPGCQKLRQLPICFWMGFKVLILSSERGFSARRLPAWIRCSRGASRSRPSALASCAGGWRQRAPPPWAAFWGSRPW